MRKTLAITVLLLAASATPSLAQSVFDGPYVGVEGGYGVSVFDVPATGVGETYGDGFIGGAFAGYGQSFDMFYLGVEGSGDLSEIDVEGSANGSSFKANRKGGASASARIGVMPYDDILVYATGGVAASFYETEENAGQTNFVGEGWQRAYRLGAGIDKSISDDAFIRAGITGDLVREDNVTLTTGVAKVGLGFRF